MKRFIQQHDLILAEAAVVERLRRSGRVELHPRLAHAPLIYDESGRGELRRIYRSYLDIAGEAGLPIVLCTPTWRANRERVFESRISRDVNRDAVAFMRDIRCRRTESEEMVMIGGLIGCKNDTYRPEEGLSIREAENFHLWQIGELARAGADFLIAETLPNVHEAAGIAKAMSSAGVPYIISFVIDRRGCVLDGTPLAEAVVMVDEAVDMRPLGYMVNCAFPAFLRPASQPASLFDRLIGYQGNASSLDQAELDGSAELRVDDVVTWGELMLNMNREHGITILGGCCGTGTAHLEYLARH